MPRLPNKGLKLVQIRVAPEQRKRLEHHARRLGIDMSDIIRDGMFARLDLLDEKELLALEAKRAREGQRASAPYPGPKARGMVRDREEKKRAATPPTPTASSKAAAVERNRHSFRRWAELIEAAIDRSDAQHRADLVLADIRAQTKSDSESEAVFDAFKHFQEERRAARPRPSGIVDVSNMSHVEGDVD